MTFWILDERDRFTREGEKVCFYEIESPLNAGPPDVTCPVCHAVAAPGVWRAPRRIRLSKDDCGDLILGVAFEIVVSARFRDVFTKAGLTGITDFGALEIGGKRSAEYYAARPKIAFTRLNESASGVVWRVEPQCSHCRLGAIERVNQVVLDETTWDGSDIFMATGLYSLKIVSEKFVQTVRDAKLTNVVLVEASHYRT